MKIGFEIYFENEEMTFNAPNLFIYIEDDSSAQVIKRDSTRICAKAIEKIMNSRKIYDKLLRLSRAIAKEVQE